MYVKLRDVKQRKSKTEGRQSFQVRSALTCGSNAVKSYKPIETGSGSWQDTGESKWHEAADS